MTGKILKVGTPIELDSSPPQPAVIGRWTAEQGTAKDGWHVVRFADGGRLVVHESRFRVIAQAERGHVG